MISRYGYIPNSSDMDRSGARNLGLFLSDFVVNVGPLHKRDENMFNEEEGVVEDRYSEGDSFEYDTYRMESIERLKH
jgi:hypothetical protein